MKCSFAFGASRIACTLFDFSPTRGRKVSEKRQFPHLHLAGHLETRSSTGRCRSLTRSGELSKSSPMESAPAVWVAGLKCTPCVALVSTGAAGCRLRSQRPPIGHELPSRWKVDKLRVSSYDREMLNAGYLDAEDASLSDRKIELWLHSYTWRARFATTHSETTRTWCEFKAGRSRRRIGAKGPRRTLIILATHHSYLRESSGNIWLRDKLVARVTPTKTFFGQEWAAFNPLTQSIKG